MQPSCSWTLHSKNTYDSASDNAEIGRRMPLKADLWWSYHHVMVVVDGDDDDDNNDNEDIREMITMIKAQ